MAKPLYDLGFLASLPASRFSDRHFGTVIIRKCYSYSKLYLMVNRTTGTTEPMAIWNGDMGGM